ncbi:hypothetical protein Poli38472_012717 [Pythium oligandrum]|uniref:Uncharacterized protein n=1 Tax=Pythium oligandrum TaxID=41045 RepID=A0A8K1CES9_PYTOL|nr:hypothetical protein Poli38472_012717 [Pythium oligandrum]|eukprot:TMW61526.1 hypothetical protein Poli38472_012717 [Pythium oligandrum]
MRPTHVLTATLGLVAGAAQADESTTQRAPVFDPLWRAEVPIEFDFYVLAQSWQPEFCHGKESQYPGCTAPLEFWRTHFTMHGLWPDLTHGKHPGFCGGAPFDADLIEKALGIQTLLQFWPNVKVSASSPDYPEFWKHEWMRHGTCSGLEQVEYFTSAINIIRNDTLSTPSVIQENVGKSLPADKVRAAYADTPVALKCDHGGVLSQVFSCWGKDAQHRPTARQPCPEHILSEDTCTKGTILIPAFP